jgi:hypothetical protein
LQRKDDEIIRQKGLADLPGLERRLGLQTVDQIIADMKAAGQEADDANAFLERYWKTIIDATITIHEGRHALDQKQYQGPKALTSEELEFRAKLSELEFSEYPRLDLGRMVNGQIGGDSSHGKANTRILKELKGWIEAKSRTVEGLDSNKPLLPQAYKLTDTQIREFACSLDQACTTASKSVSAIGK